MGKGRQIENGTVASPESVPIHLKMYGGIPQCFPTIVQRGTIFVIFCLLLCTTKPFQNDVSSKRKQFIHRRAHSFLSELTVNEKR